MAALTTAIAVAGVGLAAAGAATSYVAAGNANDAQHQMIGIQQQQEAERRKAMELDSRRRSLEVVRNQQRARALALTTATAQGAQFGSGLQGAYGQISGQGGDNLLGIYGQREIGRNLFGLNQQLGTAQGSYADAQTMAGIGSGLSSLGGAIIGNIGTLSAIGKGFGSGSSYGGINQGVSGGGYLGSGGNVYAGPGAY